MDIKTDDIIQKYFEQKNILVNHQIESYNYYVDEIIPKIINQYFPVLINFNDSSYTIQNIKLSINKLQCTTKKEITFVLHECFVSNQMSRFGFCAARSWPSKSDAIKINKEV